jgi:hypothetical protein
MDCLCIEKKVVPLKIEQPNIKRLVIEQLDVEYYKRDQTAKDRRSNAPNIERPNVKFYNIELPERRTSNVEQLKLKENAGIVIVPI